MKLKTGRDRFRAVRPLVPIPREIKKVSIRIYTDTPKELITFANMYLKKSRRIGFLSIKLFAPRNIDTQP